MIGIADMIMTFLFFPVTLFVIIPLVMLSGWLLFRLTKPLMRKREVASKKDKQDEVVILTS